MRKSLLASAISTVLLVAACSEQIAPQQHDTSQTTAQHDAASVTNVTTANPLLTKSTLQYETPDFALIKDEHFLPAFEQGMQQHMTEVLAIA
ncbi:MAG: dipeptidyl carboxypeptidase II, partial [Rheinheimera sp.]|nr:dipeptidyl carboxypeptidase II [Rheinheimera sp.]